MTTINLGGWLLVALAIVGLAFAAPVVSAHGDDPTDDDASPSDGTTDDWAAWMAAQMTDHMGPGSVAWMESHMGVTVDEMVRDVGHDDYHGDVPHDDYHGDVPHDDYHGGMGGQGHC